MLVDDHDLVREALVMRLRTEAGITVVGSVNNAGDAIPQAQQLEPDIVLMDIEMPGKVCFDAAREIKKLSPGTNIIFLTGFCNDHQIQGALEAGALGYLTKDEPTDVLVNAIRLAASGVAYFSPKVQSRIEVTCTGVRLSETTTSPLALLTKREIEVLRYVARGSSRQVIAEEMHVSIHTVDNHISGIKMKLGVRDRVEIARLAIREGLISA